MANKSKVLCCVLIGVLIGVVSVDGQAKAKICDVCSCSPNTDIIQYVTCVCNNSTTKNIYTTVDNMRGLNHIKTFSVSHCESITFNKGSFVDSHDLTIVTVSHVGKVNFPVGVFSSLTQLKIEDVEDLRLEQYAFTGVNVISEISIRRTSIKELATFSLFDTHGLRRFELNEVTIGHIKTHAIKMEMNLGQSTFIMDSCKVEDIDSDGIVLTTDKLLIKNSSLDGVSVAAVNVSAVNRVDIIGSKFGNGFYGHVEGLVVNSNVININNNTFDVLPIGILNSYERTQGNITFTNNLVYNFTLDPKKLDLSLIDFSNNQLICNCELAKSVLAYQALMTSNTDKLVENNYCKSNCNQGLTLKMLSENINYVCDNNNQRMNVDFLCNESIDTSTTQSTPLVGDNVGISSRLGKSFDEDFLTSDGPPLPYSGKQHANNDAITVNSSLLMLTYLMFVILARNRIGI